MKRRIAIIVAVTLVRLGVGSGFGVGPGIAIHAQESIIPPVGDAINAGVEAEDKGERLEVKGERGEVKGERVKEKKPSKGLLFFYGMGDWVDRYLMRGIDPDYIALPEHSWRLAYTNAMIGVNSNVSTIDDLGSSNMQINLLNRTTPSVDLGFHASYRGIGFGYSGDALHAYQQRLSFSFGSKFIGIDFAIQTSSNMKTDVLFDNQSLWQVNNANIIITNANLNLWYALNAAHYSHQAAIKQSYIQKKTAGSLLLHLSYMSSQVNILDTMKVTEFSEQPVLSILLDNLTAIRTRQIAIGLGYGINYTPNKGKVLLHASANAMLVTYSVNLISYYVADSISNKLPGNPMYNLEPSFPVHVTGNVRAAVSWEINKWVHLSAWATGENIRFHSKPTAMGNIVNVSNWNWKVQAHVGVRFGAGKDRLDRALMQKRNLQGLLNGDYQDNTAQEKRKKSRIPEWITGYFWSPKY